jgi:hypothetical protein
MFKAPVVSLDQFRHEQKSADKATANDVFKVLHGFYGALFLSKYATGQLDEKGRDQGIGSARAVWAHTLQSFGEQDVIAALEACKAAHPEFPPSLPQFVSLCRAAAPRKVYKPEQPALGMSQQLRSQMAARARATIAKHEHRALERRTGDRALPMSLDGLKQAIASAVATAGGDEVAELVRLDRLFSLRSAT